MSSKPKLAGLVPVILFVTCVAVSVVVLAAGTLAVGASADASAHPPASAPGHTPASSQASEASGVPLAQIAPLCSPDWSVVSSPNAGLHDSYLNSVVALSGSDMWAVGYYSNGPTFQTLAEHWDGSAWTIINSPNVGLRDNYLFGVAAVSSSDVWAVGYYSTGTVVETLVEHWDGSLWSVVNSPNVGTNDSNLTRVAAVSGSDMWAVGYYSNGPTFQTLAEHWDGSVWTITDTPNEGISHNYLKDVAAISSSDVWAVGYYSNENVELQTLVEHWDGSSWSIVDSPNMGANSPILSGVAAASAGDVWAVGSYTGSSGFQTLAEHWDGRAWSIVDSPNIGMGNNIFSGVAAVSAGNVWAVGNYYNGPTQQTLVEHWNGTFWTIAASPNVGPYENFLNGVATLSTGDVRAVGYYLSRNAFQTLVEQYNPCIPTATPTAIPTATPTTCPIRYTDVPPGSTFYPYVRCLACKGIIEGYPDGTFKPNNPITRGQLSKIVSNSAGYGDLHMVSTFQDVPPGFTFFQVIERLATRGIIQGYPCGGVNEPCVPPANLPYFRPNANMTRGQTSKVVASARHLPAPPPGQQTFQDVPVGSTFRQWIEALAAAGIIQGYPCGVDEPCVPPDNLPYFRPGSNVTRGQASKIVGNTFFPNCQTPEGDKR